MLYTQHFKDIAGVIILFLCSMVSPAFFFVWFLNYGGGIQIMSTDIFTKLFDWKKAVDYKGNKFYIRIVSESVVNDAQRYALLESRKLRKLLRDSNTDDYLIYLDSISDLEDDEVVAVAVMAASRDVMRDYMNANPKPQIDPLPDNATQEDLENYEQAKEERDELYIKNMQESVEAWRVDFTNMITNQPRDKKEAIARKHRIDRITEDRFTQEFEDYIVASSIYEDKEYKKRALSLEQYKSLPADVKTFFKDSYNSITIGADDVKN